jgi:hypothetical protein
VIKLADIYYKDKASALKAKRCYVCECPMDGAYVVATFHGKKELHFPLCSPMCLDELSKIYAEIMDEKG